MVGCFSDASNGAALHLNFDPSATHLTATSHNTTLHTRVMAGISEPGSDNLNTLAGPSVARFCRQYLQLEHPLDFPEGALLREEGVQQVLFRELWADGALSHPPPPRYQLRVLKELVSKIEASIEDWEQHVRTQPTRWDASVSHAAPASPEPSPPSWHTPSLPSV